MVRSPGLRRARGRFARDGIAEEIVVELESCGAEAESAADRRPDDGWRHAGAGSEQKSRTDEQRTNHLGTMTGAAPSAAGGSGLVTGCGSGAPAGKPLQKRPLASENALATAAPLVSPAPSAILPATLAPACAW